MMAGSLLYIAGAGVRSSGSPCGGSNACDERGDQ
jgi:hypothetical protein